MPENEVKVVGYGQLSNYQKRTIITIASKQVGIDRIANLLKPLKFCTPETTLKVVKESKVISDEDFEQLKTKLLAPTADELKQVEKTEQTAAKAEQTIAKTEQTAEEPTTSEQAEEPIKAEPERVKTTEEPAQPEQKKQRADSMSKDDTMFMISRHLEGFTNAEIGQLLGRTETQIAKRLSYVKKSKKFGYLFNESDKNPINPKGEKTMEQKKEKCYVAKGTGYAIVDAIGENITVNGNGILRELTKYFEEMGLDEFYGKVEVRVTVLDKLLEMEISEE